MAFYDSDMQLRALLRLSLSCYGRDEG